MRTVETTLIVVLVIPLAALLIATAIAYGYFGRRTINRFPAINVGPPLKLTWEDCTKCTSGTQWWDGSQWTTIPEHVRVVQENSRYFEPRQMNVRKCPHCQLGGWWRDKTDSESK